MPLRRRMTNYESGVKSGRDARPSMEMRSIGSLSVSVIGVGCNNFGFRIDEARSNEVVDAAEPAWPTSIAPGAF